MRRVLTTTNAHGLLQVRVVMASLSTYYSNNVYNAWRKRDLCHKKKDERNDFNDYMGVNIA